MNNKGKLAGIVVGSVFGSAFFLLLVICPTICFFALCIQQKRKDSSKPIVKRRPQSNYKYYSSY